MVVLRLKAMQSDFVQAFFVNSIFLGAYFLGVTCNNANTLMIFEPSLKLVIIVIITEKTLILSASIRKALFAEHLDSLSIRTNVYSRPRSNFACYVDCRMFDSSCRNRETIRGKAHSAEKIVVDLLLVRQQLVDQMSKWREWVEQ